MIRNTLREGVREKKQSKMSQVNWPTFDQYYQSDPIAQTPGYVELRVVVVLSLLLLLGVALVMARSVTQSHVSHVLGLRPGDNVKSYDTRRGWLGDLMVRLGTMVLLSFIIEAMYEMSIGIDPGPSSTAYWSRLGIISIGLIVYYLISCFIYAWIGFVFFDKNKRSWWTINYRLILNLWGVSLFVPAGLLSWTSLPVIWVGVITALLYIAFRITLLYRTLQIIDYRIDRILHIFLYLCGREIGPFLFLALMLKG